MISKLTLLLAISILSLTTRAQHQADHAAHQAQTATIEPQPLLAQAARLKEALAFLGSSLSASDEQKITALQHETLSQKTVQEIQKILDPYCLAIVDINPESRVKVTRGAARAKLIQNG